MEIPQLLLMVCLLHTSTYAWDYHTKSEARVDIGFAVDRHESIDSAKWATMMDFLADFAAVNRLNETGSRLGLVSFDQISTLDIKLKDHVDGNLTSLQADIRNQPHGGYGRDISLGIFRLREDLFRSTNGDQVDSVYGNVGVIITNGNSDADWAKYEAELFRDTGATLISVGVGDGVDVELLESISGGAHNVLLVPTFPELYNITFDLRDLIVRAVVPQLYCDLDVCVAIDREESVSQSDWSHTLEFLSELAWMVDIDRRNSTFGVVSYDANATLEIPLNKHSKFSTLHSEISEIPHGGSGRSLEEALRVIRQQCFSFTKGDRPGIENVAILVASGASDRISAIKESKLLQDTGTKIQTVGVGPNVDYPLLVAISTGSENVFHVMDFMKLAKQPDITLANMCPGPPPTTTTTATTTTSTSTTSRPTSTTNSATSSPTTTQKTTTTSTGKPTSNAPTMDPVQYDDGDDDVWIIVTAVMSAVVVALVLVLICYFLRNRASKGNRGAAGTDGIRTKESSVKGVYENPTIYCVQPTPICQTIQTDGQPCQYQNVRKY